MAATGTVAPKPQGGDKRSGRIETLAQAILALVNETPDITLAEIAECLAHDHHQHFAPSVIHRFPARRAITFKKMAYAAEQDRPDVAHRRRLWSELRLKFDPGRLVFIDETGASIKMTRLYGRARRLLTELRQLKYRIQPLVLDAADFGAPQTRRRLFVLCDRERDPPDEIKATVDKHRPATQAIRIEGPWVSKPLRSASRAKPTLDRAGRAIEALGEGVPFLIVYYGSDGAGGWQTIDRPLRTLTTLDRFGLVTWQDDEPMLRMLQVDELREAMGFPSSYRFENGSRRDRIKMLGNGVAPPVMEAVVRGVTRGKA